VLLFYVTANYITNLVVVQKRLVFAFDNSVASLYMGNQIAKQKNYSTSESMPRAVPFPK
jgi:hypothetical protein